MDIGGWVWNKALLCSASCSGFCCWREYPVPHRQGQGVGGGRKESPKGLPGWECKIISDLSMGLYPAFIVINSHHTQISPILSPTTNIRTPVGRVG